ncbi:hypothetical protein B0F90DRAFT_299552 [Multifurca ochricompacta]|uniref:Uncharacterized protein n=1 Tax=Multifurca ochricompacta TaxID=376703 RepID=A0AAD4QJI2_9AGAM|nr:hypothetical protein B0F90DRAFT_299552 [Multifurca ochricompacta]
MLLVRWLPLLRTVGRVSITPFESRLCRFARMSCQLVRVDSNKTCNEMTGGTNVNLPLHFLETNVGGICGRVFEQAPGVPCNVMACRNYLLQTKRDGGRRQECLGAIRDRFFPYTFSFHHIRSSPSTTFYFWSIVKRNKFPVSIFLQCP